MSRKPVILPLFLMAALGSVYLLPSAGKIAQSAVNMDLPKAGGGWTFRKIPPSEAETKILAKDTEFSKAECRMPRPGEYFSDGSEVPDILNLSVVLSGVDINNSIHRPERCMPAQGHQILSATDRELRLANGKAITARRLHSIQRIPVNEKGTEHLELQCLTYYFFVGHDRITSDHLERTFIDMKDRLIKGMDQRWAYVSASMWFGQMPWSQGAPITEEEADEKLAGFLETFAEEQIDWERVAP